MAISVAIVGLGKIAEDQHVPVIAKDRRFQLAAVVSQRGRTVPGVPVFRTLEELLASGPAVDTVAVCTPPNARHAIARTALLAGKHVLLEKPPAQSVSEAVDLAAVANSTGLVLFATWHSRFNAAVAEAKRRLAGQRIAAFAIEWKESVRKWHPGQDWVFEPGGYGVFDPGINAFSILTEILPAPAAVRTAELRIPANRQTPIAASLTFSCPAANPGAVLTADLDWLQESGETWTITVTTEAGERLALTQGGTRLAVNGQLIVEAPSQEYEAIYDRFASLLASGQSEVDLAPHQLVADAFLAARVVPAPAFAW